jgi:hypothetical protein
VGVRLQCSTSPRASTTRVLTSSSVGSVKSSYHVPSVWNSRSYAVRLQVVTHILGVRTAFSFEKRNLPPHNGNGNVLSLAPIAALPNSYSNWSTGGSSPRLLHPSRPLPRPSQLRPRSVNKSLQGEVREQNGLTIYNTMPKKTKITCQRDEDLTSVQRWIFNRSEKSPPVEMRDQSLDHCGLSLREQPKMPARYSRSCHGP